jgi:hypothetical protein
MRNRLFGKLAVGVGLTAMLATSALNATVFYSERVEIPFEFKVGKQVYSAGEYRLEQNAGAAAQVATLVNLKTGRRVQMLLVPVSSRNRANGGLTFETQRGVRVLKSLN